LERGDIRNRQLLAAVTTALEDRANQVFMLPRESPEQNGYTVALLGGKRPLYRAMKMGRLIQPSNFAQSHAFRFQALLDFEIIFNVYQFRRHYDPPA
jgi:hypothetical protein